MDELNVDEISQNIAEKFVQKLKDNGVFIGRWIPVSERLPDIHNYFKDYFITTEKGDVEKAFFTEINGKCWWSKDDVIAWMLLPEPYKAESEVPDASNT